MALRRTRTRLAALAAIVPLVLGLAAAVQAPASARTFDPPTISRVTWTALKYEISKHRVVVGPSRETGYGKLVLTGLVRVSGTRNYRSTYKVYDESRSTMGATRTLKGVCWPWDSGTIFGCSSPMDPKSWDWKSIFDKAAARTKDYSPLKPFTYDNQRKCARGAFGAATFSTVGKTAIGNLGGYKDYVRVTPQGYAVGIVASCIISLWW